MLLTSNLAVIYSFFDILFFPEKYSKNKNLWYEFDL